jgi:glycogen(starch) synthase
MDHSLPLGDGYCIRAKYLLEAQAARGHDVVVLTSPSQGPKAVDQQIGPVMYRRSHYSPFEQKLVSKGLKHFIYPRAIARVLHQMLTEQSFDVVHAHTPFTVARVAYAKAREFGLPFIYEKRNLWEESARARGKPSGRWPLYQIARSLDRSVTLAADAVCTITAALRERTLAMGADPARVVVVGNGVDTDAFVPREAPAALRTRALAGGEFVVGFIGSFFSFEGLPLLVDAFASLRSRYPGLRMVLVGEGEDYAKVKAQVAQLGLDKEIWLTGRVPHGEVLDYYACMDALVYPRYSSALTDMISPLKPLEPMAMGRCVVASDVGGLRELIKDNETGLLFEAGSKESLAQALERLISRSVSADDLGRRSREFVIAHRQWRHMAEAYDTAYACAGARTPVLGHSLS